MYKGAVRRTFCHGPWCLTAVCWNTLTICTVRAVLFFITAGWL